MTWQSHLGGKQATEEMNQVNHAKLSRSNGASCFFISTSDAMEPSPIASDFVGRKAVH